MKKILGWFVVLNLFAAPLGAQENLQPVVEAVLAGYPSRPLSTQQLGEALNEVARRSPGWGLHRKSTGHRCQQPAGVEVSCDLLVHQATGGVFDVLIDADGLAVPTWGYVGPINTMTNFVAPMGGVPDPGTGAPPVLTDLAPVLHRLDEVDARLAAIAGGQDALVALLGELQAQQAAGHDSLRAQIAAVKFPDTPPAPEPEPEPRGYWSKGRTWWFDLPAIIAAAVGVIQATRGGEP